METNGTTTTNSYGFTASGDSPDFVTDASNAIQEKYLTLPGNVLVTIRPTQTGTAAQMFSLPNLHGDVTTTTDASGTKLADFSYDPFGNKTSTTLPTNTTQGSSFAWVGQHQKQTETDFTLQPIQMGARVYLASIGRFLQVDPVEGGTPNNYVYPTDPVGDQDLSGMCPWCVVILFPVVLKTLTVAVGSYGGHGRVPTKASQLARNIKVGKQLEKQVEGRMVKKFGAKNVTTQKTINTPYGKRRIDIQVNNRGNVFNIETKYGHSRYTKSQRMKDAWMHERFGIRTYLYRNKR